MLKYSSKKLYAKNYLITQQNRGQTQTNPELQTKHNKAIKAIEVWISNSEERPWDESHFDENKKQGIS